MNAIDGVQLELSQRFPDYAVIPLDGGVIGLTFQGTIIREFNSSLTAYGWLLDFLDDSKPLKKKQRVKKPRRHYAAKNRSKKKEEENKEEVGDPVGKSELRVKSSKVISEGGKVKWRYQSSFLENDFTEKEIWKQFKRTLVTQPRYQEKEINNKTWEIYSVKPEYDRPRFLHTATINAFFVLLALNWNKWILFPTNTHHSLLGNTADPQERFRHWASKRGARVNTIMGTEGLFVRLFKWDGFANCMSDWCDVNVVLKGNWFEINGIPGVQRVGSINRALEVLLPSIRWERFTEFIDRVSEVVKVFEEVVGLPRGGAGGYTEWITEALSAAEVVPGEWLRIPWSDYLPFAGFSSARVRVATFLKVNDLTECFEVKTRYKDIFVKCLK